MAPSSCLAFGADNNFILADLGKACLDGVESLGCDTLFVPPNLDDAILQRLLNEFEPGMGTVSFCPGSFAAVANS